MNIKEIARTKEGRLGLMNIMRETLNASKLNWQGVKTPEDIVREMVRLVPDVKALQKILVLFNIEFLECLIKEMGIDPSCVTMICDTEVECEYAKKIYGVYGKVIVEHTLEGLKKASSGCEGFDVIFSNPPYQIQSESQKQNKGNSTIAQPIYNEIVMYVIDNLKPHYLCMITPSRWMVGGMGELGKYRTRMLSDKRIKLFVDFPGDKDIFHKVTIKGGVSYFLWDRDYQGLCNFNGYLRDLNEFDVVVRENISCQILRKVLASATKFCNNLVLPEIPFGLRTNFNDWVSEDTEGAVKCYGRNKEVHYTLGYSDPHNIFDLYKICTSKGINPNKKGQFEVYNQLFSVEKGAICTQTYLVAGAFKTKVEADNYMAYMKTKFYRFMLSLRVISQDLKSGKFSWVPDMPHYNKVWTDSEMYQHFGLTKKEIEHIEKSIKTIK